MPKSKLDAQAADHRAFSMDRVIPFWNTLGLTAQFLVLTTLLVVALSYISGRVQHNIAAQSMIEGSLEIEQALARVTLSSLIGNVPLKGALEPEFAKKLRDEINSKLDPRYFNKIKLWGIDGRLLLDSVHERIDIEWMEPAVERALKGETVVSLADDSARENVHDLDFGRSVYEVYMPIFSSDGRVLAVGEIYCSVDLLVARQDVVLGKIDKARAIVGALGILAIGVLVFFAHRRIIAQSAALAQSLKHSRDMARKNANLFEESEELRRGAAESTESLLNHIGAELHDGPIQLLSLAALYRSQAAVRPESEENSEKSERLLGQALNELRNISSGLVLPELDGLNLQDTIKHAVRAFMTETDISVQMFIDQTPAEISRPKRIVAYRIVYEAMNNARKHAGGKGLKVDLKILDGYAEICISDRGPGIDWANQREGSRILLGLQYMSHRAKSVASTLTINPACADHSGTCIGLSIPLSC